LPIANIDLRADAMDHIQVSTKELLFCFFCNMPSTLVEPCLEPHKIPKNFSSDEEEDNAMLLDVRRETKKEKKKKNPKFQIQLL
jgi:hypothetical protein